MSRHARLRWVMLVTALAPGCGDAGDEAPEAADTALPDSAVTDSSGDSLVTDSADTSIVDSSAPDTFVAETGEPDTAALDTFEPDTFLPDTFAPDTFVADTFVPDTFVPDTFLPDTFVPDTSIADTLVADAPEVGPPPYPFLGDLTSLGTVPAYASNDVSLSSNGRFVGFLSSSSDLVPGDTNLAADVFVRDAWLATTRRASLNDAGDGSDYESYDALVSGDGRYAVFSSDAWNLTTPPKTGFQTDVFRRDLLTGKTDCVSVDPAGRPASASVRSASVSADGRWVAFESTSGTIVPNSVGWTKIFVRDMLTGVTTIASVSDAGAVGDGASTRPALSPDGRYVVFVSKASNLVPGDTNGVADVFLRDLVTKKTERISVGSGGEQANGEVDFPVVSADGSLVLFSGSTTTLVAGTIDYAWDLYLRDRTAKTTTFVGPKVGDGHSIPGLKIGRNAVSADLRYVAFESALDVTPGKRSSGYDIYVLDRTTGEVRRANRKASGEASTGSCVRPALSADGSTVAFLGIGTDLLGSATPTGLHVFVLARP